MARTLSALAMAVKTRALTYPATGIAPHPERLLS